MTKFSEVTFLDIEENKEYAELIEKVAKQAFKIEKIDKLNLYINVILTNPINIKNTNKKYRNIDRETDVITFRLADYEEVVVDGTTILGDIYISLDKAHSQAEEYGHSYKRELSFLLIHGFLHLLWYDHMNPVDEKVMFKLQEEILDGYGIKR